MARNRGKKSLYEVMGKNWPKPKYDKSLRNLHPDKVEEEEPKVVKSSLPPPGRAAHWPRKPKIVQFNAGRIEISLPYTIAITLVLGIVLVVLVIFRLDEIRSLGRNTAGTVLEGLRKKVGAEKETPEPGKRIPPVTGENEIVPATGSNRIVIQTYHSRADLERVQDHFAVGGIETEIRKIGATFYLMTVNKYDKDPKIKGTDGYAALQQIISWGARYKAPQGFETFATRLFSDAYGKKFED